MLSHLIPRRCLTLVHFAALAAAALGPVARADDETPPPDPNHPAVAVPAAIDLGYCRPEAAAPGRIWLINRSDEAIHLTGIKSSCGCITTEEFADSTLGPHAAMPIDFHIKAPAEHHTDKTKHLSLFFEGLDPVHVALTIGACAAGPVQPAESPLPVSAGSATGVVAAPGVVALGEVAPGATAAAEGWIINTADAARTVVSAKSGCGCISLDAFKGLTLEPNEARLVPFTVRAPKEAGKKKATEITFLLADDETVTLPVTIRAARAPITTASARHD